MHCTVVTRPSADTNGSVLSSSDIYWDKSNDSALYSTDRY